MTPKEAKELCILAHAGQYRRPRELTNTEMTHAMSMSILKDESRMALAVPATLMQDGNMIHKACGEWYLQEPYHTHPIAVADMMDTDEEKIVAYLHDVIEDTDWTWVTLLGKVPLPCIQAIVSLTRNKGVQYQEYINNIANNPLARKVKIADMFHNMSGNPTDKQKAKYLKALPILLKAL